MQRYRYVGLAIVLFLIVGASLPNNNDKELIVRLQGEILVLQRQVRDLQESFDKWQVKSETSLSNLNANSETSTRTLSSIDDKLQRNQGSQNNAVAGVNAHLVKIAEQLSTNNQNLQQLGQNFNALKQSLQEQQRKLQEQERLDSRPNTDDPEQAFAMAYMKFKNREYDSAINLFRAYLRNFDRNEKSDDAAFWIAESFAAQGRLTEALREYDSAIANYPDGDKIGSLYFKKGVALLRLERRQEGIESLRTVAEQYPNSQDAASARAELARLGETIAPAGTTSANPRQRPPRQ
jgi:tol-pal system protein YbgF